MRIEFSRNGGGGGGRVEVGVVGIVEVSHLDWMEYGESEVVADVSSRVNGVG